MITTKLESAPQLLKSINFGKSIDYSKDCKDINDNEACDQSNFFGTKTGSMKVRNGSDRIMNQAVSSNPFSALFETCIVTHTTKFNVLIGVSGDTIYFTTETTPSKWSILTRGLRTHNQKFNFAVARNLIFMTGDALTDPIYKYDVINSSFSNAILNLSSYTANLYAKYLLYESNYMLAANVIEASTNSINANIPYKDRVYYTYFLEPSSFTIFRYVDISRGDGQDITGLTSKRSINEGRVVIDIYKFDSVYEMTFTNLAPSGEGGDIQITKIGQGFGHIINSPPENLGDWDAIFSKDGLLLVDGGRRNRLNAELEKITFSKKIKPLIEKLIRRNTYKNSILKYYPKDKSIYFIYEDPDKLPSNRLNSVIVYDLTTDDWYPIHNWIIGSMALKNKCDGKEGMYYGDGNDGYVMEIDNPKFKNDSRKEIVIDSMEKTDGWTNISSISTSTVIEGTASLRLDLIANQTSSITKVFIMNMGEWYDGKKSSNSDLLSFKIFPSSIGALNNFRIDIQAEDVQDSFNSNYSSVTFNGNGFLTAGTSEWSTIEIAFSSFPILKEWIEPSIASVPFAKNLTRFGLRFVATSTLSNLQLYFDDIRFVAKNKTPIDPFRTSKQFSFGTLKNKDFLQIILNRTKGRDNAFKTDIFTGINNFQRTKNIPAEIEKSIYVCGYRNSTGVTKLSSVDLSVIESTVTQDRNAFLFNTGVSDGKNLFLFDNQNDRIVKLSIASMTVFISTFGQLGSAATDFNYVQDIALDRDNNGKLLIVDHMNNRIKTHSKNNLSFISQNGQLGLSATSYYNPTSIQFDKNQNYIGDDGNQRIIITDGKFNFLQEEKLDINTIGNIVLRIDENNLFDAYVRGDPQNIRRYELILEKRNKGNLELKNRISIRPDGIIDNSTTSIQGMALHSDFIYISFNRGQDYDGNFFIQKRLKDDFSLVAQSSFTAINYGGIIGDGLSWETLTRNEKINLEVIPDPYIQLKFYTKDELDLNLQLNDMTFYVEELDYTP